MRFANALLDVSMVLLLFLLFRGIGPAIDTRWFPVYSKFSVAEAVAQGNDTLATFRFTKFRNCNPQGYAFYVGDVGTFVKQLNARRKSPVPPVSRPLGTQLSSPFLMEGITPQELNSIVFAEVYSDCGLPWVTVSKVFP